MRYAKVENGVITNMVVADSEWASEHGLVLCPDYDDAGQAIGVGATYANWQFKAYVAPEPAPEPAPAPAPTLAELTAQLAALSAQIQALTPAAEPVVEAVVDTMAEPVVEVTPEPTSETNP